VASVCNYWWQKSTICRKLLFQNLWKELEVWILACIRQWHCVNCVIHHEWDMCEEQKYICLVRASNNKKDCDAWSLLLLAAAVRSFAHMPLGISDRNKMVLWPGCGGRAEFSLHTKNVRSVWFVVKRKGCCCSLSGGVALIVWFTTNGMCAKNKNIYVWREQAIIREIAMHDLYCCLLPQCEALRTFYSGFPIATVSWLSSCLTEATEEKESKTSASVIMQLWTHIVPLMEHVVAKQLQKN